MTVTIKSNARRRKLGYKKPLLPVPRTSLCPSSTVRQWWLSLDLKEDVAVRLSVDTVEQYSSTVRQWWLSLDLKEDVAVQLSVETVEQYSSTVRQCPLTERHTEIQSYNKDTLTICECYIPDARPQGRFTQMVAVFLSHKAPR